MAHPQLRLCTSSCSLLLIYLPWKDERLSRPGWLTYSGPFTHISGQPSAVGRAQDRESSTVKDQRSTTVPRNQHIQILTGPAYRVTTLIETNALPLGQTDTVRTSKVLAWNFRRCEGVKTFLRLERTAAPCIDSNCPAQFKLTLLTHDLHQLTIYLLTCVRTAKLHIAVACLFFIGVWSRYDAKLQHVFVTFSSGVFLQKCQNWAWEQTIHQYQLLNTWKFIHSFKL